MYRNAYLAAQRVVFQHACTDKYPKMSSDATDTEFYKNA